MEVLQVKYVMVCQVIVDYNIYLRQINPLNGVRSHSKSVKQPKIPLHLEGERLGEGV